ncbi:precorrin-2 dehydrogenase/sirohydrochlorin ferrochelatase family protein [Deinococcus aquatilis]|uniref:precorrin-2 dehydrogenase/sirohydrochlorin ferrochelatase family protein n=1 Tax=Deinococcus aquatilis TaxID=519440 RepID=UPI000378C5EE|nr:bifunctional precorrin-2 dehydrogenase/sirohydrochlorin ferrochelatase [Deinococcus aquatilis]
MSLLLPVFLELRGEPALVVGGGAVALRRVRTLLDAGLTVTVVAPELHADLVALPVQLERRAYRSSDVQGRRIVVAATDSQAVNDAVSADARAAGALVNHAGDAGQGSLRFAATTMRAGVQVAVSSGRELPMLTQALTERIAQLLPTQTQVDGWSMQREKALELEPSARAAALAALRVNLRAGLGLADPEAGEPRVNVQTQTVPARAVQGTPTDAVSGGAA